MKKLSILFLLSMIVLTACGPQISDPLAINLDSTSWTLVQLNGQPVLTSTEVWISFEEGQVDGNGGCNQYGGEATYKADGTLSFGALFMTEMFCMEDGISGQESQYHKALSDVTNYKSAGPNLILLDTTGKTLMEFTPR